MSIYNVNCHPPFLLCCERKLWHARKIHFPLDIGCHWRLILTHCQGIIYTINQNGQWSREKISEQPSQKCKSKNKNIMDKNKGSYIIKLYLKLTVLYWMEKFSCNGITRSICYKRNEMYICICSRKKLRTIAFNRSPAVLWYCKKELNLVPYNLSVHIPCINYAETKWIKTFIFSNVTLLKAEILFTSKKQKNTNILAC